MQGPGVLSSQKCFNPVLSWWAVLPITHDGRKRLGIRPGSGTLLRIGSITVCNKTNERTVTAFPPKQLQLRIIRVTDAPDQSQAHKILVLLQNRPHDHCVRSDPSEKKSDTAMVKLKNIVWIAVFCLLNAVGHCLTTTVSLLDAATYASIASELSV